MTATATGSWQQDFKNRVNLAYERGGREACAWYVLSDLHGRAREYEGRYLRSARSLVTAGQLVEIDDAGVSRRARGFIPAREERE